MTSSTPLEIIAAEDRVSPTVIVDLLDDDRRRVTWELEPYAVDGEAIVHTVICCRVEDAATVRIPVRDLIAARASGRAFFARRIIDL